MNSDRAFVILLLSIGWVKSSASMQINYPEVAALRHCKGDIYQSRAAGGLGLGLAAAFALGDAACWRGFGKLAWKGVKSKVWAFAISNVGLRCPSFEGFWEGQKVKGLRLGWLPPSSLVMLRLA